MKYLLSIACCFLLSLSSALAEEPKLNVVLEPQRGDVSESFILSVSVETYNDESITPPSFESNEQFAIKMEQQSDQTTIVNGAGSRTRTYSYRIYPNQALTPGQYSIPDFQVVIDGKINSVTGPRIEIIPKTARAAEEQDDETAEVVFRQIVDTTTPYVGQQITYRAKLITGPSFVRGELSELEVPSVLRERLGKQEQRSKQLGKRKLTFVSEVLIPTAVGTIEIPQRTLTASLAQQSSPRTSPFGRSIFDFDPFDPSARRSVTTRQVTAEAVRLEVRPLPPPPAGVRGYVPVGTLNVTTKLSAKETTTGNSITLSIDLLGRGNLRPVELPQPINEVPEFRRYDDQPTVTTSVNGDKIVYRKSFSIALVPTKPGTFTVPQFEIHYFDPQSEQYASVLTEPLTVTVTGDPLVDSSTTPAPTPSPTLVESMSDGLLPQHEDEARLTRPYREMSNVLVYSFLILTPLLLLAVRLGVSHQRISKNPSVLLRQQALSVALRGLSTAECSADQGWNLVTSFISARFGIAGPLSSTRELSDTLRTLKTTPETLDALGSIMEDLENSRFSGNARQPITDSTRKELIRLLTSLDTESEQ